MASIVKGLARRDFISIQTPGWGERGAFEAAETFSTSPPMHRVPTLVDAPEGCRPIFRGTSYERVPRYLKKNCNGTRKRRRRSVPGKEDKERVGPPTKFERKNFGEDVIFILPKILPEEALIITRSIRGIKGKKIRKKHGK